MGYYGEDKYRWDPYEDGRLRSRGRAGEAADYVSHRPVTTKVGAGRRARITVETGGDDGRYQQQHEIEESIKRREQAIRLEESKLRAKGRGRYYRSTSPAYKYNRRADSFSRRRSSPTRSSRSSSPRRKEGLPMIESSDEDYDDFDFSLPKPAGDVKFSESVTFEIPSQNGDFTHKEPASTGKTHFSGSIEELHISQSRWVGSSAERGELGGEIVTIPTSFEPTKENETSGTKWFHLTRSMLNFEEFSAASLSVLRLSEKQQRAVSKLLRDVQKKFEKQRHHGRDMDPDCIRDFFVNSTNNHPKQSASVMFL